MVGKLEKPISGDKHRFEIFFHPTDFARFGAVDAIRVELTDREGRRAICAAPSPEWL
jgi:hypothetical protein